MYRLLVLICALIAFLDIPLEAMSRASTKQVESSRLIGVRTYRLQDASRNRPVAIEVWYPTDSRSSVDAAAAEDIYIHPQEKRDAELSGRQKTYPLIMMSHGHRGTRRDRSWLAERLVQSGYVVASVEHHGNSFDTFDPILTMRFWERAKDVSFALDSLLTQAPFSERIDPNRIGFVGYSLGGMTGLALGGSTIDSMEEVVVAHRETLAAFPTEALKQIDFSEAKCKQCDPRIRALLLLAPANFVYKPENLKNIRVPVGLVSSVNDEVLPHDVHAYPIIQHVVPVKLKVLRANISHYAFLNPISEWGKKMLPEKYRTDPPCCSRAQVHKEVGDFALEFFDETVKKRKG